MADSNWSQLYDEAKTGVVAGIAADTYQVKVVDVRSLPQSRLLFLDLGVQQGPQAGKIAQVNLYLPEPGNRGAGFHFRNKIMGFGDLTETFKQMDNAPDIATSLEILADSLKGREVTAVIELRADGEYAGTNQLTKTKPVDDVPTPAAAAAGSTPSPAAAAPPAAAPEAPAAPPADATAQEPAMAGEVPF